jgi:hypothetical protein
MPILIALLLLALSSQAQIVTNWITPGPNYRSVSNQVYDVTRSAKWETFTPPSDASISVLGGGIPSPGQKITLAVSRPEGRGYTQIENFPWSPEQFAFPNNRGPAPKAGISFKLFLISSNATFDISGKMTGFFRRYDYGLPVTKKFPVTVRTP